MNDILIVINDADLRKDISRAMLMKGYRIAEDSNYKSGLKKMEQTSFDVVIFDLEPTNSGGLDLLKKIRQANSGASPIGISPTGSSAANADAITEGAHAVLQTPFNEEELQVQVKKAIERASLEKEVAYLRHARPNVVYNFDNIISSSDKIREIFSVLKRIAETDTPVIIYGETGTGKELIAGAVHYNSLRRQSNFIKVNCAALPEDILERELFGHEAGAFEGASKQRIGRFEQANHGTLFLREVSSLSLQIQSKLLQFITDKKIKRLGATQTVKLDVRLILATEHNLKEETRAGRFNDDLFWPLNVVPIDIPPLRQRTCDIPELADYFLRCFSKELNRNISGFEADVKKAMVEYHWPGNVRELRNIVERAVLKTAGDTISLNDMAFPFAGAQESTGLFLQLNGLTLHEVEKNAILKALEAVNWVQKDAAKLLGISKRALNYKIEHFEIKNPRWIKNK